MRLDYLYIEEFKNLRKLEMDFDESSLATVVVGRNGTGKSNVLEALVLIFRNLDLKEPAKFPYRIQYECRGRIVHIDATSKKPVYKVGPDKDALKTISKKAFEEADGNGYRRYLPAHVFGYYSGPSNRMEEHFDAHQVRFYRDLLDGKPTAHLRPLFYARTVHSQFVLLAFFSGMGDSQAKFLKKYLGIHGLESVLFVLNEPPWATAKKYRDYGWFWEARGVVRDFLDRLYATALAPLRLKKQPIPLELARKEHRDHYYLFVADHKALRRLGEPYENQQALFAALESTYISSLIREVRVKVRIGPNEESLSFRELSEGEQQLLMVLGLLKFTQQEESLFLLDEPDTHLNPAWSVEYLDLLKKVVGESQKSHFIITTHDPLVVAGLTKEQVQLLERDENGIIRARIPWDDPRGMGVAALLTSEVYGLRSQLDLETLQKLEEKRRLAVKEGPLTDRERKRLEDLNKELGGIDLSTVARDPLYDDFVKAMAKLHPEKQESVALTREEQKEQEKRAIEVLRRLEAERKDDVQ
jgi:predicted ATPase